MLTPACRPAFLFNVAALRLSILSPSHYPGAPLSIAYLENLCLSSSRRCRGTACQQRHSKELGWGKKAARSCTDSRDEARIEVQGYMSQRSPASGPPSNAPRRDSQALPPLSPSLSRAQSSYNAPPESPYTSQPPAGPPGSTLRPLDSVPAANRLPPLLADPPPSRPLGVHSILNPSHHDVQSPYPTEHTTNPGRPSSPALTAASTLPQIAKRAAQPPSTTEELHSSDVSAERRILTPRSPSLRRASSGGRRSIASGPFGTSQPPLMRGESRIYTAEPGPTKSSEIPQMPLPTPVGRPPNPYPSSAEPAPGQPRRPSGGRNPFAASAVQTQGESPSTSHSSYSHFSQSSPILRYGASSQNASSLQPGPTRQTVSLPPGQQSAAGLSEGQYDMSKGSYGISIPTEGGQMLLPVELDVEQASKTANEKRKRNAGASARFRQRRKEKEREASHTISNLERNLRGLEEERNHYRCERDFFRDLYARQVGPGQVPQRPPTPHAQPVPPPSLGDTPPQWQDIARETSEPLPRNVRRRTSSYPASFPAPSGAPPMLPPQAQSYGFGPQPPAPIFQNPFPPPRASGGPPFPSQPPPSPHSSTSQDPFRRDVYSRSWNPGS
jgi:hypothetical protein